MFRFPHIIGLGAVSFIMGCSGSTDPLEADLFDNVRNINSGEYDRQIAAGEAEAAKIANANNDRQRSISSLNNQRNANANQIASLRAEIASARAELSAVRGRVANDPGKLARANALDEQLRAVDADARAGASASIVSNELKRIRRSVRALSG